MALNLDPNRRYYQIHLQSQEENTPSLFDISTFLYDFTLAYEISRLVADPKYENVRLSRFVLFRNRFRIREEDRMFVQRLHLESPFEVTVIIAAIPAAIASVWGIVQIAEKITNWPLNRRKLIAEVEKLEREKDLGTFATGPVIRGPNQFQTRLSHRNGREPYDVVLNRLSKSPIKIVNIEVKLIEKLDKK